MSHSLELHARQSCFIIRDYGAFRHLRLPPDWKVKTVQNDDDLLEAIQESLAVDARTVIVVNEAQFEESLKVIESGIAREKRAEVGIVVASTVPNSFLIQHNTVPELLDVVPIRGLEKAPEYYLYKAIRQLSRRMERNNRRIGRRTLETLNRIFITLSAERDPQRLLSTILDEAIQLTSASGGTLHVVKEIEGEIYLTFRIRKEGANATRVEPVKIKVTEDSIAGYVVLTGKLSNLSDIRKLAPHSLPQFRAEIDHDYDKQTTSVLTVPLKNTRNEIIAVIQLVNKRDSALLPFETEDESIIASLGTQAAICLENVELYADIQKLFDGFAKASIIAIESRDPSTAGHSERVAKMSVALARATNQCDKGIYRSVVFREDEVRELEYAALLHDFGKIGVREEVLVKAKKLYPHQLQRIEERLRFCRATLQLSQKGVGKETKDPLPQDEFKRRLERIDHYLQLLHQANEPTVLKKENVDLLNQLRAEKFLFPDGSEIDFLNEEEFEALSIPQGTLTESERIEVESHVRHTYQFLKMIPWTRHFKDLPEIAYCHHEKLDGTGYPRGLTSHEIPLQSKIMTIADIFDALTAADRWYKDAVPIERALDILASESDSGKLDPVLFELFLERKIYLITHPDLTRKVG